MKFYTSELATLLSKISQGNIKSILFYGPNRGYIKVITEQITKKLNLLSTTISAKDLSPSRLNLIANSQNFFKQKELIKIIDTPPSISKDMKELLKSEDFNNFICFVADDSLPSSGIRKFYEEQSNLASVACYYDNEQTVAKAILQQCAKRGKTIEEEALYYLKSHLKGDHNIIKNELEKLFNYTHDKKIIFKQDVLSILSPELLASGDEMCIHFGKKNANKFLEEIQKLKEQNINEVLIIRALIRYYINLYIVTTKLEDGEPIDQAIKLLSPPIFFKYINDFKQIVQKTLSQDAIHVLMVLQNAEISFKSNPRSFDFFTQIYLAVHTD
jgi:DNA polymerase III subunit delta